MKKLLSILFLLCVGASAQVIVGNFGVKYVSSAPAGSCSQNEAMQIVMGSGVLYTCQLGTWGTVGGGATPGTVTSVTFTGDGVVDSSTPSTAVTTTGTLTATLNTQTQNTVLAGSNGGGTVVPTFRAIVGADITTGTITGTQLSPTIALGTDNSVAGTMTLSNSAAAAHTVYSSGATTTNTIAGFTVVPVTGDLVSCTSASTTCTLTDAGILATNIVRKDVANTAGASMTLDMSGVNVASAFRVPNIAGATSATDGTIVYDTTQKNTHIRTNGADTLAVAETAAVGAGAILKSASATKSLATASSMTDDATTVTSAEPYVFGTAAGTPNTDKTVGFLTAAMGAQTTATCTNVTNMTWNLAASKNYRLICHIPRTLAASATIQYCLGGPGTATSFSLWANGALGTAAIWGQISTLAQTAYGTKTNASAAAANTTVDDVEADIQNGSTASGTALTLQTAANGTNAITIGANASCDLKQVN